MQTTTRQLPDQPAVDGTRRQLTRLRAFPGTRHVVQEPLKLGGAEVGIDHQPGPRPDLRLVAVLLHAAAKFGRAPVLPDQRAVHRLTRGAVPQHDGFALIGDADACQ